MSVRRHCYKEIEQHMHDQNRDHDHRSRQGVDRTTEKTESAIVIAVNETDESSIDKLADTAVDIAGPAHATVHLVRVFSGAEFERTVDRLNYDVASPPDPDEVAARTASIREATTQLKDPIHNVGVPVAIHGRIADSVGASIVEVANDTDASQVIIGHTQRSSGGGMLFRSTAQYVLLNAPCPVTFVRGG
ncbi:universal stress protein [Haladaptatus sp. DYF46]|uniref:universal stress protein n=1 Tax=Haladaptatus sp. DYF46 TaxID=2886041 RepID=UPI001E433D4B|nr:universal stress protein [Haladaptatus sp. DYF46]